MTLLTRALSQVEGMILGRILIAQKVTSDSAGLPIEPQRYYFTEGQTGNYYALVWRVGYPRPAKVITMRQQSEQPKPAA